jgi:diketogulonate reductase-like aldo/keto reductase
MTLTRRTLLKLAAAAAAGGAVDRMRTRPIPRTGEQLPVIGMGTWRTFDVPPGEEQPLRAVLAALFDGGGRVIDSSPMYGRAEEVVGELLQPTPRPFLATKVWTSGREQGIEEMRRSMRLMWPGGGGVPPPPGGARRAQHVIGGAFDLIQVHNLLDWQTHVPTLRAWKEAGTIRYWGITHYSRSAFDEMERILKSEKPDFVQLPYSVGARDAEKRLLPACAEAGAAVLVMRPFEGGSLFRDAVKRPLPGWAAEIDCTSWAQIFLKFILGHPAVNCPIPATSNARHMADDVRAGFGRLPDEPMRRRIAAAVTGDLQ